MFEITVDVRERKRLKDVHMWDERYIEHIEEHWDRILDGDTARYKFQGKQSGTHTQMVGLRM